MPAPFYIEGGNEMGFWLLIALLGAGWILFS